MGSDSVFLFSSILTSHETRAAMAPLCWPAEIWLQVKGLFRIGNNNNGNNKEIIQSKVKTEE